MTADYGPKYKPGQAIPMVATGTVAAGNMTTVAGAVAAADSVTWLGVASQDAASGQDYVAFCDGVQRLTAAGAISAGAIVKCAASGQVTTWTTGTDAFEKAVGLAMEAASGANVQFAVRMFR
jgi:hypothetical protein